MRLRKALCMTAIMAVLAIGVPAVYAQDIVLQIGSTAPVNSPWDIGIKKIASEWSRISGGTIKVVFPKSVASASQEDLIQKLKFSLDGAILDTTGLGFIDADIFMLSMPSVIRDDAEYDKAMAAAVPLIKKKLGDRYEVVAVAKAGYIRFFSNKPISTPDDLRKLRLGVTRNQDSFAKLFQSMGVRTVKADSSSTLLQFSSGSLDAMYSSPLFVAALWSQYKRAISYMSPFKVSPFFGAIIINKRSWDKIPESLRPALRESAEKLCAEIGKEAARLEAEGIEAMKRSGLIVPPYGDAEAKAWDALYADKVTPAITELFTPAFTAAVYASLGR